MSKHIQKFVIISVLGLSIVTVVFWSYKENGKGDAGQGSFDLSGGAPVQRERIDSFIERVGDQDIEQLELSLASEEITVFLSGMADPLLGSGINVFEQVCADRRVRKIYQEYREMGQDVADRKSRELFDYWIEQHGLHYEEQVRFINAHGAEDGGAVSMSTSHACASALLLMLHFCEPQMVVRSAERFRSLNEGIFSKIDRQTFPYLDDSDSFNRGFGVTFFQLDDFFFFNLFFVGVQRAADRPDAKAIALNHLGVPNHSLDLLREGALYRWDAETLQYDFTHIHRLVPPSMNDKIIEFSYFRTWWPRVYATTAEKKFLDKAKECYLDS